jgi:hypothetical protein
MSLGILMVLLIIGIITRPNSYIAHSLTVIKQSFIIQASMLSILGSYIYNVEYAIRISLEEILASLDYSIHRNSRMEISNQPWGWMIRSIIASQMTVITISYR